MFFKWIKKVLLNKNQFLIVTICFNDFSKFLYIIFYHLIYSYKQFLLMKLSQFNYSNDFIFFFNLTELKKNIKNNTKNFNLINISKIFKLFNILTTELFKRNKEILKQKEKELIKRHPIISSNLFSKKIKKKKIKLILHQEDSQIISRNSNCQFNFLIALLQKSKNNKEIKKDLSQVKESKDQMLKYNNLYFNKLMRNFNFFNPILKKFLVYNVDLNLLLYNTEFITKFNLTLNNFNSKFKYQKSLNNLENKSQKTIATIYSYDYVKEILKKQTILKTTNFKINHLKTNNSKIIYLINNFRIKKIDLKLFLYTQFYFFYVSKHKKNKLSIYLKRPIWLFFFNYSIYHYRFYKLYLAFVNYLFYFIKQKFSQIISILRLKNLELTYDIIRYKDNTKYHLGITPQLFITTFNRRFKKGFRIKRILSDLAYLLNKYIYKRRIKGYYIRIKGRFARGRRKRIIRLKKGFISFNSLNLQLNSCYGLLYTKFGISGIKIIVSN